MILHITTSDRWAAALKAGVYHHISLEVEGFIHCSTSDQLIGSAENYFRGQSGLVILCIAEERVSTPIIYEDSLGSGQEFPHIYGDLNVDAVSEAVPFPAADDGSFYFPEELERFLNKNDAAKIPTSRI